MKVDLNIFKIYLKISPFFLEFVIPSVSHILHIFCRSKKIYIYSSTGWLLFIPSIAKPNLT